GGGGPIPAVLRVAERPARRGCSGRGEALLARTAAAAGCHARPGGLRGPLGKRRRRACGRPAGGHGGGAAARDAARDGVRRRLPARLLAGPALAPRWADVAAPRPGGPRPELSGAGTCAGPVRACGAADLPVA